MLNATQNPSPFSTFRENYNFLSGLGPEPGQQDNVKELTGTPGDTSSTSPPAASSSQLTAGVEQKSAPTTTGPTSAPGLSGDILNRLFGPLQGQIGEAQTGLQQAKTAFQTAAGPSRTYEGIGAEGTLGRAVESAGADTGAVREAQNYLGAAYTGPAGLDSDESAKTADAIEKLYGTGKALGTGGGLYGLVKQAVHGLTQGEARSEALSLISRPDFRSQAAPYREQTGGLEQSLESERKAAESYAKERAKEEADIATKSRSYLTGREAGIEAIGEQRIAERQAERAALEKLYQGFHGTGDLSGLPPEVAAQFQTSVGDEGKAAQAKWDEIVGGQYADIKDIPLLQIRMTKKGKEARELPSEFKGAITPAQMDRVIARQNELSKWFDPGSHYQEAVNTGFGGAPGNYASFKPLYFNEDPNLLDTEVPTFGGGPKDFQNYAGFDPGDQPILTNQLGEEDIGRLNVIRNLLGEGGELTHDDAPFRQAQIAVEAGRFLNDQIRMLEEQKGNLSRQSKEYLDELHKTRKDFRKAERQKKWGKVGRAVMDFATFGTYEGVRPFLGHHRASPLADDTGPHGEAELGGAFLANT